MLLKRKETNMGLFNFTKRQLLKVIEWEDDSKDTVVYRYPLTDRDEIMNSSTLVVRPSQCAIFVHKGQIADVFSQGTYKLASENIPFLTKLLNLPTGFNSPIKAEVYFINIKQFTGQKWGTQNPIIMRDADFGNIRLRGFGIYSFKVSDPKLFMKEMFGTNKVYTCADIATQCKPMIIQGLSDAIAESKISALDLAANYKEFSTEIMKVTQPEFSKYGLELTDMIIENLSLPEQVERALDERTTMGVMEDKMGTYTQYKIANALEESAKNPNGNNLAGLGVGLGAGVTMSQVLQNNLTTENKAKTKVENMVECTKCGAKIKEGTKFCPECGAKQSAVCPKCGTSVRANAKFCPECGTRLTPQKELTCPKCGAKLKANSKFCPECGEKIVKDDK